MSNRNIQDGFWDSIVSALPTIGKIVSGLIGALTADGEGEIYNMNFLGTVRSAEGNSGKAVFTLGVDSVTKAPIFHLCNTSAVDSDYVVLSTPTQETVDAETIVLPGCTKCNVNQIFKRVAEGGCDTVALNTIQSDTSASNEKAIVYASNRFFKISEETVTNGSRVPLGSLLTVKINTTKLNEIEIAMDGAAANCYAISMINTINIESPNTQITVNPPIQNTKEDGAVILTLPEELKANETYRISAEVSLQVKIPPQTEHQGFTKLSDEELRCLRQGKPLLSLSDVKINLSELNRVLGLS